MTEFNDLANNLDVNQDNNLEKPYYDSVLSAEKTKQRDVYDARSEILLQGHTKPENIAMIRKAYAFAKEKHDGVKRNSGEPYISHPLAVAMILHEKKADFETICAALLHDVIEDCNVTVEEISQKFSPVIAKLVYGVTNVSITHDENREVKDRKTINKLAMSMQDDIRIVLIKLADRKHNMQTIDGHKTFAKKARISNQTLDIYVPMAAFLGDYKTKEELEDLCFKTLMADKYKETKDLRDTFLKLSPALNKGLFSLQYRNDRNPNSFYRLFEEYSEVDKCFKEVLPIRDVKRVDKSIYAIYKRLTSDNRNDISQIKDLVSYNLTFADVKIDDESMPLEQRLQREKFISERNLYDAMYIVNSKYKLIPDDPIIDYVTCPKTDLYRCLITGNSFTAGDEALRIRMRYMTQSMFYKSIHGIAGFWNYDDMDRVKEMQRFLTQLPVYTDLVNVINEYQTEGYTYEEFFRRLNEVVFPQRIYIHMNETGFVEAYEGMTIEEFIMKQNGGFIDLNNNYYVNGNLVDLSKSQGKPFRRQNKSIILHNNDIVKIISKDEVAERNMFGGISRKKRK